ncbi:uncharacterized protein CDAR_215591 [Caerostris darwini]|uniref:Uncharacterized protein n=1 Tax=Caerostris darwini TaxID=1538125 RepID=A0AAV4VT09_9ARAC|nr:uncharacterized protein CDAR_215591 [Caerostris darwini]
METVHCVGRCAVWVIFVCCLAKLTTKKASEQCEDLGGTKGGQSRLVHLMKFAEDFQFGNSGSEIKEWTTQRKITIRTLNELREKLDSICVGSNYVKHTGNSVGILGTITSVVGSFMSMFELPSVPFIKNIGDLMYQSGCLVDGMSNIVESTITTKYLREIDSILKKDKELSIPFQDWLKFSSRLDANIKEIFGRDLHSEELINVVKVLYEFSRLRTKTSSFKETVDLMKRGEFSLNIDTHVTAEHFRKFSKQLDNCPKFQTK